MTSVLYFEKQSANLCGQHCLNNLMQSPKFSLDTLMTVAGQLDQEERKLLADNSDFASTNVSASSIIEKNIKKKKFEPQVDESGNFSLQVLRVALNAFGISLKDSQHRSVASSDIDLSQAKAFVCNLQHHWFAIRRINDKWFNLNSLYSSPRHVSDFYLNAYMAQLRGEGYRIFIVSGHLPEIDLATSFRDPSRIHYIDKVVEDSKKGFPSPKTSTKEIDPEVARAIAASLKDLNDSSNVVVEEKGEEDEDMEIARAIALSTEAPTTTDNASSSEEEEEEDDDEDEELARAIAMSTTEI